MEKTMLPGLAPRASTRASASLGGHVEALPLQAGHRLPLVLRPTAAGVDLVAWITARRATLDAYLLEHRAVLLRGFGVADPGHFRAVVTAVSPEGLIDCPDESTPRTELAARVFTSTSYPSHQSIRLHNEGSYCSAWPGKIFFGCLAAADEGGETPIADVRRVAARLAPALLARFAERGVRYVRNFNPGVGLTWQQAFWTDDPAAVDAYCQAHGIERVWLAADRLRTTTVRPAFRVHPTTRERLWFNHAAFFHAAALDPEVRATLLAELGEHGLPFQTFYGDGAPIALDDVYAIQRAYADEATAFSWRTGDVMVLDNMTVAHGRRPFRGARKVVVAITEARGDAAPRTSQEAEGTHS